MQSNLSSVIIIQISIIIKMRMNILQKLYREFRMRNIPNFVRGVPFLAIFQSPQFTKYAFFRIILTFGVAIPIIGIFRRAYIINKFNKYLASKNQAAEIQLKESIAKFDIKIPSTFQYMIIVNLDEVQEKGQDQLSDIDRQNSRKIFNLVQQAQQNIEAQQIKWAFLGNKKLYQLITNSRLKQPSANQKLDFQFHQNQKAVKQAKVFLIGRDPQGQEKILMEWNAGVPFKEITKYIAKHKYKKYLTEVTF